MTRVTRHILTLLLLTSVALLTACAPPVQQSGHMDVAISVYVQPRKPLDLSSRNLLVAPVALYSPQAAQWVPSVTGLVQDIFSQERVFHVIQLKGDNFESRERMLDDAAIKGFDYVLFGSVPPVIFPAGNTTGWVGFDMRLVNTADHVTLWHIYGQASLAPAPTRRSILGDGVHADAPAVSEGFTEILRKMAGIINCQGAGRGCTAK